MQLTNLADRTIFAGFDFHQRWQKQILLAMFKTWHFDNKTEPKADLALTMLPKGY